MNEKEVYLNPEVYGYGKEDDILPGTNQYYKDNEGNWVPMTTTPTTVNTPVYTPKCQHDNKWAYTTERGNITFDGSPGYFATVGGYKLVFDLGRSPEKPQFPAIDVDRRTAHAVYAGPTEFVSLNALLLEEPKFIDFTWNDYDILHYAGYDFWEGVANEILKYENSRVLVSCVGGHGRTGTFLSIVCGMIDGLFGHDIVPAIRNNYCKHAVETPEQFEYVVRVLAGDL